MGCKYGIKNCKYCADFINCKAVDLRQIRRLKVEVPGFDGKYLVTYTGKFYRVYESCTRLMNPTKKHKGHLEIKLMKADGYRQTFNAKDIIACIFIGPKKKGMFVDHKDKDKGNISADNLFYQSKRIQGERTGHLHGRGRSVSKKQANNPTEEVYTSARAAAKANFMSYQTVIDRCNGKVKNPVAPDGYIYHWVIQEDDYGL